MISNPRVAIVYLSFHCEPYLDDVVSALKKMTYSKERVEFIVVDNPHPEHGPSVRFLEENLLPISGAAIPHVTILPQKENLGFAGGNNVGIAWAIEHGFDYVFFHNNDGFVAANCLGPLVNTMEQDRTIGLAQSLILLHPDTELVNSAGNSFHYLGFGFCEAYRFPAKELQLPAVQDISYASGAAVLMRTDLLKQYGAWDEDFFLYHEDMEYSFRLQMAGFRTVLVRDSVFYHKYQFSRSITKFYWMERNRYGVLLMFFRIPTLILLLPMLIVLDLGLWLFAWKNKWVPERIRLYQYWIKPTHWRVWLAKRKKIQALRTISDRKIMTQARAQILFQEAAMMNPILRYIGNPMMSVYYWLVVRGLIWW